MATDLPVAVRLFLAESLRAAARVVVGRALAVPVVVPAVHRKVAVAQAAAVDVALRTAILGRPTKAARLLWKGVRIVLREVAE